MKNGDRAKDLVIQAQRRLKEVALDFDSQFASYHRHQIDSLCQEILDSLERDDQETLTRAETNLQDTLYELNREVRLEYNSEMHNFFNVDPKWL